MARHNTCENPSLSVSDAGWGDGGADVPVRTSVAGFPAPVVFAARYSGGGSYRRTPVGAAVAGLDYTASLYIRSASLPIGSGVVYFEWLRSDMSPIGYVSTGFTTTTGVVTRASITGTAPALTAYVRLILDGWSTAGNATDIAAALYEQSASLLAYFDGDSTPGGSWDGTTGLSASTLNDAPETHSGTGSTSATATLTSSGASGRRGTGATTATAGLSSTGAAARRGTGVLSAVAVLTASGSSPDHVIVPGVHSASSAVAGLSATSAASRLEAGS